MSAAKYGKLDDIGFIGFQDDRSKAEFKKDAKRTIAFIKAYKTRTKISKKNIGSTMSLSK